LEEVSYYFPSKTLFRTFFCCIAAALSLKFLDPYGTSKIVIFEVRYITDWRFFELFNFAFLGIAGGLLGALFIKASRWWATTFRRIDFIKTYPMAEVALVSLITGLVSFWNKYTTLAVTELLFELAAPCDKNTNTGLCPEPENIPKVIRYLLFAFVIKAALTVISFGIKVPAGIYVPSMVVGGLMGRIVGHITQYLVIEHPNFFLFSTCPAEGGIESCVVPGVYALVAAGATMCGVTRLSVTLAVIMFELTGSLDHVLPFSLGVMFAKWTADAVEPLSIYDLLTQLNDYPYLENKVHPVWADTELGDITRRTRRTRLVDITLSPMVRAPELREKLTAVQASGELDGGLPIIRDGILYGLLPVPDLEWALDRIEDESTAMCLMTDRDSQTHRAWSMNFDQDSAELDVDEDAVDLLPYIDMSPIALDIHSPMDLVYQCFVKLGLRYICAISEGRYVGMLHKKAFVRYVKEMEEKE
jgi:chloride channel 3/4/5